MRAQRHERQCQGVVAGELERADFSQTNLMRLMAGLEAKAA